MQIPVKAVFLQHYTACNRRHCLWRLSSDIVTMEPRFTGPYDGGTNMSVLDEIIAGVVEDLGQRISETPLSELRSRVADVPPALDTLSAFREPGVSIIAEVKRKSPSKGELADIPDPASLARPVREGRSRRDQCAD